MGGYLPRRTFDTEYLPEDKYSEDIYGKEDVDELDGVIYTYRLTEIGFTRYIVVSLSQIMLGSPKEIVFDIPISVAESISKSDYEFIKNKLDKISSIPINDESIISAYYIAYYFEGHRTIEKPGVDAYRNVDISELSTDDIADIRGMILRTVQFFRNNESHLIDFERIYRAESHDLITYIGADFITQNTMWCLKTSKKEPNTREFLQLLTHYISGVFYKGDVDTFKDIENIGIYNIRLNKTYTIPLSDIPYEVAYYISSLIFRPELKDMEDTFLLDWFLDTFSQKKPNENYYKFFEKDVVYKLTDFKVDDLSNGIYPISKDDYWTYMKGKYITPKQPQYPLTKQIYCLKNNGYVMFISENHNDKLYIMNGGSLKRLDKSLDYYYQNLPEYVEIVKFLFGNYFEFLMNLSNELLELWGTVDKSNIDTSLYSNIGRIHGSIVDFNYFDHMSVDFFDGLITLYSARNMSSRKTYSSIRHFLKHEMPYLTEYYDDYISSNENSVLKMIESDPVKYIDGAKSQYGNLLELTGSQLEVYEPIMEYSTDMYSMSGVLKKIQRVFTDKHVVIWADVSGFDESMVLNDRWVISEDKRLT